MSDFRRLTPEGVGPVCVWLLTGALPQGLRLEGPSGPRGWPGRDEVCHARLFIRDHLLDDVIVVGCAEGLEIQSHGGAGIQAGLENAWRDAGLEPGPELRGSAPACERAAVALASARSGPLEGFVRELDQELGLGPASATRAGMQQTVGRVVALQSFARRLAVPALVRLVGPPNVGKSTLFNALLGSERALVSPQAGTTRDPVEGALLLEGVPVHLQDTAGIDPGLPASDRGTPVRNGRSPDLFLCLHPCPGTDRPTGRVLDVASRCDRHPGAAAPPGALRVSGLRGDGLDALRSEMARILGIPGLSDRDAWVPLATTVRAALDRWAASGSGASL